MLILKREGFLVKSNIASYGAGNDQKWHGHDAYYLDAAGASGTAATLLFGEASKYWCGNLAQIVILRGSTSSLAQLSIWDSNDPAVSTNCRSLNMSLYGGTTAASQAVTMAHPLQFRFSDGLCAQITDATANAKILFQVLGINKRASAFK